MKTTLKFIKQIGAGKHCTNMYRLNGINIGVSLTDKYVCEKHADPGGKKVICISFSDGNKPIPPLILEYTLRHFGINTEKPYYINTIPAHDFYSDRMLDIVYYEQTTDKKMLRWT